MCVCIYKYIKNIYILLNFSIGKIKALCTKYVEQKMFNIRLAILCYSRFHICSFLTYCNDHMTLNIHQ